jgi:O-acetyl-ADP-ribose deacetylase (regulator of RNase III)
MTALRRAAEAALRVAVGSQPSTATFVRAMLDADTVPDEHLAAAVRVVLTRHTGPIDDADVEAIEAFIPLWRRLHSKPDDVVELPSDGPVLRIWQGDITLLKIGCIVNAANEQMLGCFTPMHACIDNVIHWHAGPRLRLACEAMMADQPPEPFGQCRITPAFLLPSQFVAHTVGPDLRQFGGAEQPELLASCYVSCLNAIKARGIRSIAFCGISTGVFLYPKRAAAIVAVQAVRGWLSVTENRDAVDYVVFNTFDSESTRIYVELLGDEARLEGQKEEKEEKKEDEKEEEEDEDEEEEEKEEDEKEEKET